MDNIRLACALCRIIALRVCNRIRGREPVAAKPEKHVVCIGLTQSGKSTALALLAGEPIDKIEPTDGFHIKDLLLKDCMLNVKEIGGSEKIRKYWKHYYGGAQGVIFMVDGSSDVVQLETARKAMQDALSDPQLSGLPILLLVTHQDRENCRSFLEISQLWKTNQEYGDRIQVSETSIKDLESLKAAFQSFSQVLIHGLSTGTGQVEIGMLSDSYDDDDDICS